MATDYGGTHGGQPWHDARPQYTGQPPYGESSPGGSSPGAPSHGRPPPGGPPYGGPSPGGPSPGGPPSYGPSYVGPPLGEPPRWAPPPGPALRPRRRTGALAVAAVVLGGLGLAGFGIAAGIQVAPRTFTPQQRREITDWEVGQRWRDLTAGEIFPASLTYPPPTALDDDPSLVLSAERVGVARQATCASATDPAAAAALDREGCAAILRATYVDVTDSYAVTVGAAVLPDAAKAQSAARAIAGARGTSSAVHAVPFAHTPAAAFTDRRRQLSGVVVSGTYVVLYTVGYTDSRPKEPVTGDSYAVAEMTSAGVGVAHDVLSVLAAPVPPPACPGTPGC